MQREQERLLTVFGTLLHGMGVAGALAGHVWAPAAAVVLERTMRRCVQQWEEPGDATTVDVRVVQERKTPRLLNPG